jgi:DNA-binding beta-propeller fold protein YncE
VVLGVEDISAGFLWVSNADGTVSKLDLVTGAEVARYLVGYYGSNCDSPSRTAVDGFGNAYVATRAHVCAGSSQGVATKMAGDRRFCTDRNGNTVIDTSTGSTPLPLGQDECIMWTVPVGGPGAIPRGVAIDLGDEGHPWGWPWIAAWTEMRVYKLDPDTGAVITSVNLTVNPYGLAADGLDGIWVSGRAPSPGFLQRFDTVTGVVEERILYGGASGCGGEPYGIAVDRNNRVWAACWKGSDACAARWDPASGTWLAVNIGRPGWGGRGIATGADGSAWMSIHHDSGGGAMASWNGEDGSGLAVRDIAGVIPVGIALDELGQVWTVNNTTSDVTRLTLATGILEQFPVGPNPYTYSDFTGYQRRMLVPRGTWIHDYERCHRNPGDHWAEVSWDVTAPPGRITIAAQSAETEAGLDIAPLVTLAVIPDDEPPVDIEEKFAAAGQPTYPFLRLTVVLEGTPDGGSPTLRTVHARWHCSVIG